MSLEISTGSLRLVPKVLGLGPEYTAINFYYSLLDKTAWRHSGNVIGLHVQKPNTNKEYPLRRIASIYCNTRTCSGYGPKRGNSLWEALSHIFGRSMFNILLMF